MAAGFVSVSVAVSSFLEAVLLENRREIEFALFLFVVIGAPGLVYATLTHYARRRSTTAVRLLIGFGTFHCLAALLGAMLTWFVMNGELVELAARILLFAFLFAAGAAEATALIAKRAMRAVAAASEQSQGFEPILRSNRS